MKVITNGRVLFAALFVVVFAIVIVTAWGYNPKARTFPLIVAIPVFLGAIANLILDVRVVLRGEDTKKEKSKEPVPGVVKQQAPVAAPALEMATAGGAAFPPVQAGAAPLKFSAPPVTAKPEKKKKEKLSPAEKRKRELTGIAWLIGFVLALGLFGFPIAICGYMIAFMRFYSKESWKLTLIYTGLLFAFIWIAFVVFLKSNLYWGLIFDWIGLQL